MGPALCRFLAAFSLAVVGAAESPARHQAAPAYSAASVVSAATNRPDPLAPNMLATLYGAELSYSTKAISADDLPSGILPTTLPGTGVRLFIANLAVSLIYVSPTQINFVVPSNLRPGQYKLQVARDGLGGPAVDVVVVDASPGFFQSGPDTAIATHLDGALVTAENPARPGEDLVMYASGLGQTAPDQVAGRTAPGPARIAALDRFRVLLNGEALGAERIYYAGVTPGFGGLYQVNLRLPDEAPDDPQVQLQIGDRSSPEAIKLPLRRP